MTDPIRRGLPDNLGDMANSMASMFATQDELNESIIPGWRTADLHWRRAAWVECGELMGHLEWKWWKLQEINDHQARLEVIDIWHFLMSELMITPKSPMSHDPRKTGEYWAHIMWETFIESGEDWNTSASLVNHVQLLALTFLDGGTLPTRSHDKHEEMLTAFVAMAMHPDLGMPWVDLHRTYVAKKVLNEFRQIRGYKEGEYDPVWPDGREDNQHLVDIMNDIDEGDAFEAAYGGRLINRLNVRHKELMTGAYHAKSFTVTRETRRDNRGWPEWMNRAWNKHKDELYALSPENHPNSHGTDHIVLTTPGGRQRVEWGDTLHVGDGAWDGIYIEKAATTTPSL